MAGAAGGDAAYSFKSPEDIRTGNLLSWPQVIDGIGWIKAWDTCLTSPGTLQAKKQFVNTKKATKSLQLFCRLTQNVNVSPWALNSSQKIRSTTGLL